MDRILVESASEVLVRARALEAKGRSVIHLESGEPDFPKEALPPQRRGQIRVEDLEGDKTVVLQVTGEIDRRHPAAAELALDRVAAGEGGLQVAELVGQAAIPGRGTTPS